MNFEECIRKKLVKKITKNTEMSKSLLRLTKVRKKEVNNLKEITLKVEYYYEIIKELMTGLLAKNGFKSYSHKCLIYYLEDNNKEEFTSSQLKLIDQLRIIRNDIAYRGIFVEKDFLERNEKTILEIIKILEREVSS